MYIEPSRTVATPHRFIESDSNEVLSSPCLSPRHVSELRLEPVATVTLPYNTYGDYQNLARVLQQLSIHVRLRPNHTLRHTLVKPKDPVPEMSQSTVVYRIPCQDCPKTYVGESNDH